jgi:periplasmic protein TonB
VTVTADPRRPAHVRLVRAVSCAPVRSRRRRTRRARVAPLGAATATAARASLGAAGLGRRRWWTDAAIWALALAAHTVVAVAVWRTRVAPPVSPRSTRITVQVHDAPPPSRTAAATPIASPRPSVPRAVRHEAVHAPHAAPPVAAPPPAPVKLVGLSLESTSEAGQGPTFAVGGTLDGVTATTAARPPTPPVPTAGPNRTARGLPRPGSVLTPPRLLREVKPRYPDARRASGLEADVLLVVSLDAAGRVLSVTVGRSSHDDLFDDSARQAAREERFSPALRDGVPVATTFSFTTHFRLDTP